MTSDACASFCSIMRKMHSRLLFLSLCSDDGKKKSLFVSVQHSHFTAIWRSRRSVKRMKEKLISSLIRAAKFNTKKWQEINYSMRNFKRIWSTLKHFRLRPESHDQVFCTIFWHQSCKTSCKSMIHYCGPLSSITLNSPSEKENQMLESFADFLRRNRTELYFPNKFSKSYRSQWRKLSF